MRCPHRCQRCGKHFVLRRNAGAYTIPRRCPKCRSLKIRFDAYEYARRLKRRRAACYCYAAHYPHRPGSLPDCDKNIRKD